MLLHLRAPDAAVIAGLVPELSSGRLKAGAVARFVSEAGTGPAIEARLRAIGHPGGEGQALNYLSSPHGGPVGVAPDLATGRDMPVQGHLPVYLSAATMAPAFVVRGSVVVEAEPESVLGYVFGRVVTVVLRESGF
ncbi:MAG: hypothetical protein GYA66_08150 [Phyllobacteriaceae bacterium]|nr:hypothetical protein [Phyllobacteriaceae bacterium]